MAPRIPRKKGQPVGSKKHSDLYTDENPKGTIKGLGFKNKSAAQSSVAKIKNDMKTINDFHDFFNPYNPTETFGKRVPTSITTGRLLDKLK